ncbi:McrB family protein, partial [Brachyspira hampsonii]
FAWGYAIKPRFENPNLEKKAANCNKIIQEKYNELRSDNYYGYVEFEDCECFYENLEGGTGGWGQRIDVDKWNDYKKYGIYYPTSSNYKYNTIQEISKEDALNIVRALKNDPNFQFKEDVMEDYKKLLENNYNLILTGAPGTGKTYLAKQVAAKMIFSNNKEYAEDLEDDDNFKNQCKFVQFHPSYDYTDFVEGLRPIKDIDGKIGFERKDGVFKEFCKNALQNRSSKFVFIIDEINRGEISKIFGELFFAIDTGYRGEIGRVKTQYNNLISNDETDDEFEDGFFVPENVYIIGTMNDIDRSVESMDFAMRRRFAWKEIKAKDTQYMLDNILDNVILVETKERMNKLNEAIEKIEGFNSSYHIGASYFLKLKNYYDNSIDNKEEAFNNLWENHLKGLLYEYLRGMPDAESQLDELKNAYNLISTNGNAAII